MTSYLAEAHSFKLVDAAGNRGYFHTQYTDESYVNKGLATTAIRNTRSFPSEDSSIVVSSGPVATNKQKTGLLELSHYMNVLKLGLKKIRIVAEEDVDSNMEIEIVENVSKFLTGSAAPCY